MKAVAKSAAAALLALLVASACGDSGSSTTEPDAPGSDGPGGTDPDAGRRDVPVGERRDDASMRECAEADEPLDCCTGFEWMPPYSTPPPPGEVDAKCAGRPMGSTCYGFSDGYVWLISAAYESRAQLECPDGTVVEALSGANGGSDGTIRLHRTGTSTVKTITPCAAAQPLSHTQCQDAVPVESTPPAASSPLTINGDGTVVDTRTGLTWQREPSSREVTFAEAKRQCSSLFLAGSGWRLPEKGELESIVDKSMRPTIDAAAFPETPADFFWTATTDQSTGPTGTFTGGWIVNFADGITAGTLVTDDPVNAHFVRCVR